MRTTALIAIAMLATACGRTMVDVPAPPAHVSFASTAGAATLTVSVADTQQERQKGLSGMAHLPSGHGMAFVFASASTDRFWMKDTLIPLSVAFVGADGTVVAIRRMTPCTQDPCPTYGAPAPYTLAVEAAPAWFDSNHVAPGSSAVLSR